MIRIACHVQDYYFEIIKKYFTAKDYYLEKFNPASYDGSGGRVVPHSKV